jgi:predicted dehydrogenase
MTLPALGNSQTPNQHTFTILGVGRHGLAVTEHLLRTGRWQLTSAADRSAAAYARFQYQFHDRHIPFYETAAEALADRWPEVVYIAATAPAHAPLVEEVLAAGFPGCLLIEKPVATSLSEAARLRAWLEARPTSGRSAVNFNRRCSQLYLSAKTVIDSGELGRLIHVDYTRPMKLSMKGAHYIDLINWYTGAGARTVSAQMAPDSIVDARGAYYYDPPGYVEIEYASGQTACVDALGRRAELPAGMQLHFEHGRIEIDVQEQVSRLVTAEATRVLADESGANLYDWITNTFDALVAPDDCRLCSIGEAADSLAIVAAAHWSHRLGGQRISFPLPAEVRTDVLRLA